MKLRMSGKGGGVVGPDPCIWEGICFERWVSLVVLFVDGLGLTSATCSSMTFQGASFLCRATGGVVGGWNHLFGFPRLGSRVGYLLLRE